MLIMLNTLQTIMFKDHRIVESQEKEHAKRQLAMEEEYHGSCISHLIPLYPFYYIIYNDYSSSLFVMFYY